MFPDLKYYVYTDYSLEPVRVVFECLAEDMLQADKKYTLVNGIQPPRHVACEKRPLIKSKLFEEKEW